MNKMKKVSRWAVIGLALLMVVAFSRTSAAAASSSANRQGKFDLGMGAGLAFHSPIRFDLQFNGEYFFWDHVSIGMDLDFLLRGPTTFVFQPFALYHFDIPSAPRWVPYVGGGLGLGVNTNGNGFMDIMIPKFGIRYEIIDEHLFIGTDMSLHVITNFDSTTWDFRWLIATLNYRF
jgi:hypothetical protein